MPLLTVKLFNGQQKLFSIVKRITSVGRSSENDLVIDDPTIPSSVLHLEWDGNQCRLCSHDSPVRVNKKNIQETVLSNGDIVVLGDSQMVFSDSSNSELDDEPSNETITATTGNVLIRDASVLQKLVSFSQTLLGHYEINSLLETMIDQVIELVNADKGFLILFEGNQPHIKVARNVRHENIDNAINRVSDSIINTVLQSQKPIIVSDALQDPLYSSSESVVNLKLLSVMCAPLTEKGEVFGIIYVGNDSVAGLFETQSLELLTIWAAQTSLILRNAILVNELRIDNQQLRKQLEDTQFGEIIGAGSSMRDVFKKTEKIAVTDISVLVTGETGTGKELIAKEIHKRSPRAKGPFVTINCGAIPENLLESELFGHVRGAFTGAVTTRQGRFQAAHGGTLFLDEIGEMPLHLQVKILRALQEKRVTKVGDSRSENVDIRLISATNKNLEEEIKKLTFREDLYYRLNEVNIHLPPLRERVEDIPVIAKFFLSKYSCQLNSNVRGFSPSATVSMKKYLWPGNVRELENRIKKAIVLGEKALISAEDLDLKSEHFAPILSLTQAKEEFQKNYINEVLERNNGNRTKTAKDLGVDPRTIFRHLETERIEKTET